MSDRDLPITVVVPNGATSDAGANAYAVKLPTSPSTITMIPHLTWKKGNGAE